MQTAFCHAAGFTAQHAVGFRGAVAGNYVKRLTGSDFTVEAVEEIQQLGIDLMLLSGAMVAKQVFDFNPTLGKVFAVRPVSGGEFFAGVQVSQGQ
jgi:hypothetical protein